MNRFRGAANSTLLLVVGSIIAVVVLLLLLVRAPELVTPEDAAPTLRFFCAAGIQKPIEAAANAFRDDYGVEVQLQYAGSGELLSQLQVTERVDLYLAADSSYTELARERGLLKETIPLGFQRPVIAVSEGNPKGITSIDDLLRDDVTIALADPNAASVGKLTKKLLSEMGLWEQFEQHTKAFKPTVNLLAADVKLGAVDASIVWDALIGQYSGIESVHVSEFDEAVKDITVGILQSSPQPTLALKFARYLQAPSKGQRHFADFGYETLEGDTWAEVPKLVLYSGGVNRLAIENTLKEFERREGVEIDVIYNGCGILVGMMKTGEQPDAYFACDSSFMTQVQDQFRPGLNISETDMVIVTQPGNPLKIKGVRDLARPGLKLGIANKEQSALGALTARMLSPIAFGDSNLYDAIQPNVRVTTPTADLLINQLRAGGLDVVIVYMANATPAKEHVEIIPITEGDPTAVQPIAVGTNSAYPFLTQRLVDAIASEESRLSFEAKGFRWMNEPVK